MARKSHVIPYEPLPQHLAHKPVYAMPYQFFDGNSKGTSDPRYLSVGLAQYDDNQVSIKIMRHTGGRWTRQAEELPLHRAIDMTLFLAHVLTKPEDEDVQLKPGLFSDQNEELTIRRDEHRSAAEMARFDTFLDQHDELLKQRLSILADVLIELRASGKL